MARSIGEHVWLVLQLLCVHTCGAGINSSNSHPHLTAPPPAGVLEILVEGFAVVFDVDATASMALPLNT